MLAAPHRFHTDPHYTNRLRALVSREDLKSIRPLSSCSLLFKKMAEKSTEFSRTHILRHAPRFSGEQAHWVDYKEKLDNVLFFHSSYLRDILHGRSRPEKYVPLPNDVTVIPTYVELRRPIDESKPIPEQWKGTPREMPSGAQVRMPYKQTSQGHERLLHRLQVL